MLFSPLRGSRRIGRGGLWRFGLGAMLVSTGVLVGLVGSQAQEVDCGRLQAQIAQLDHGGGDGYARAARKQAGQLARMQGVAHQLGCDRGGFLFFGGSDNPRCPGINARIEQMQANLSQLQSAGAGAGRGDLVARFNAYCRGGQPPHERGFFESLFGSPDEPRQGPLPELPPDPDAEGGPPRGGGQAVCVRTCDGGFFPLGVNSHHPAETLNEMCAALCPGTEAAVYTRRPDSEIKTAVSLDGKPYMDLPNAMKFTKTYEPSCSCRPAGKSWAETLANAEEVLGRQRKGDILVTQEKSDEMSRPKMDPKARDALLAAPNIAKVSPEEAGKLAAAPPKPSATSDVTGPDGAKRPVRRVGPQN